MSRILPNNKSTSLGTSIFHIIIWITVQSSNAQASHDGSKCYVDDALTFYVAPHYDSSQTTAESCQTGCALAGNITEKFILAGITQGYICLCGKDDSNLTEIPIEFCSTNCVNGDNCGGPMGFFSVYDAISSKPESVTFSLVHKNDDTISIKDVNTGGVNVYLYYQIGQDTLPVNVTDTVLGPASTFLDFDILKKTIPFGKLIVTVYATDVAQTTTVSSSEIITIENPALPLKVSCPIVAEPNIPYSCGFASTPGSGSLTVKYEESGIENSTTYDPNLINAGNGLCPPGWLNILGKCYYFPTEPGNYGNNGFAKIFCQNRDGKLFEPKNNYINVEVAQVAKTVFKKANIMNDQNPQIRFRIGVNDQETEGELKYNSDGSKETNDCIFLQLDMNYNNAQWNDADCGTPSRFICEKVESQSFRRSNQVSLGNIPPRKSELLDPNLAPIIPQEALPEIILANGYADSFLKLTFVEWYAEGLISEIIINVYQPGCSLTAGGEYNPVTRYCEPISARTLSLNRGFGSEFQCTETFNDINQDCFAEDCSTTNGQCSNSPGIPDIFTKVAGPFSVIGLETEALGAHFYANIEDLEIELVPGQVIGVEGVQIGYKVGGNNIDRDAKTSIGFNGAHYVRFIGVKPEFLWYQNTCTQSNEKITATILDENFALTVTNETECQDPIENMLVTYITTIDGTPQDSAWFPELYIKADEIIQILIKTDRGLPIDFFIDYADGTNITQTYDTEGSAREIVQLPFWTDEGDYLVNITLQNLHSDKEFGKNKYIHNTTNTIHVQYPVLESFTDNLLEYWLTTDTVNFTWILSSTEKRPTQPMYNCSWGDGMEDLENEFDLNANLELAGYEFLFNDSCAGPTSPYLFIGIDGIHNGDSINACYELCKKSADCELFTLQPEAKLCHLFPTPISSNSNSNPPNGHTSIHNCYKMLKSEPAKYHIYHDYTSAGVYDVSCTLYNMVSLKTITKTITVYEKIVDFEVKTKYFEKYTNVLRSGLGVAENKIPLGQNVTFEFDYISGTIDKIIVFNMTIEIDDCFENKTDYAYDGANVGSLSDIDNPEDCQLECQAYHSCEYWSYSDALHAAPKTCWLKGAKEGVQTNVPHLTSGPKYCQGTQVYDVSDKFDAKSFLVNLTYEAEGQYNVLIQPWSVVDPSYPPVLVTFEVVGQVIGIKIDDHRIITNKEQNKWFQISFDSVGAGTCLDIDYKDGYHVAYGDREFCTSWGRTRNLEFKDGYEIGNPFIIDHIYYDFGMYNVTAYAWNFVTEIETKDELMVIVTSAPCSPPEVTIPINSTIGTFPLSYIRSESITVDSLAKVNCSGVVSTKKSWEIHKAVVNASNMHEVLTQLNADDIAPDTRQQAQLIIPARSLVYGVYKLKFFSRMWDERIEDPMWTKKLPFERDAYTYIEVIPSELVVKLIEANADLVTRGKGQTLSLDPYLYSYDPDYPDLLSEGLEFRWYCRLMTDSLNGEPFPLDNDGQRIYNESALINIPDSRQQNIDGGCFGDGPGALNISTNIGYLSLEVDLFHSSEYTLYELILEVRKNTSEYQPGFIRLAEKSLQILAVPGIPPLMGILCADPALCFTDSSGKTFVNPSSRLALKAWCTFDEGSDCSEPMSYSWIMTIPGQEETLQKAFELSPTGLNNIEMAIAAEFFNFYPNQEKFYVGLNATNANGILGKTLLYIYINKVPTSGNCTVNTLYGKAMVDKFYINCFDWIDPEDAGIKHYKISSSNNGEAGASLATTTYFDPEAPLELSLATGVHNISIQVEDKWGAKTTFYLPEPVIVDPVSPTDFEDFMNSGLLEELLGSGDKGTLMTVLQAQASVIADSDATLINEEPLVNLGDDILTDAEKEFNKAAAKGQLKVNSLDLITQSGGGLTTDLPTAEIIAQTIESIIGEPPLDNEKSDVGLEATKSATDLLQQLVDSMDNMDGISEPSQITPAMTSMTNAIGTLLGNVMKTSNIQPNENSTADEVCSELTPIDTISADKPGVVDYDTDIGNDIDMKVPEDPQAQRCNGIIDAAKLTGESVGPQLLDMLAKMSQTLLAKSVVNEEQLIETPNINIYAKLTLGKEMGKPHVLGTSAEAPWIKFPSDFCLGPLKNESCDTPAGVSAVVYDSNPMGSLPSSPRLSFNTKIIELSVSNRANQVIDVQKIYEDGKNGIQIHIPRTNKTREGLPDATFYNTTEAFQYYAQGKPQYMFHKIEVGEIHIDSTLTVEFTAESLDSYYALLLSHDHIPTHNKFEFAATVSLTDTALYSKYSNIRYDTDSEFHEWFLSNVAVKNRTGRFFLAIATLTEPLTLEEIQNKTFAQEKVKSFNGNYKLRTFHSGCYYFNRKQRSWVADGTVVDYNLYGTTHCRTSHLTSFGAGFFYTPNTVDFEFIFATPSFTDNMTIYLTIIICLVLYLLMSIWAKYQDVQDDKRLRSLACPDNKMEHKYIYEILTFTGPWEGSSCDSKVFIEITGDNGSTGTRQLDPGRKDTLRKGTIDSYILKTSRPLGMLNYLRIWHDTSGYDQYGSWFLSAIIVVDLQTGERTEFSLNRWLAAEKEDGEVERLIQASGARTCQEMLVHSAAKHIKENHLWFSIFFRSHRSRYTRLQRTSTAFAILFLAMLADAMWYGIVPEEKTGQGFTFGFLTLTPAEAFIGCMVTGATTFPAILLMFLFKKSRRTFLRPNRINTALKQEKKSLDLVNLSEENEENIEADAGTDEDDSSESSSSGSESSGSSNESDDVDDENNESNFDEDESSSSSDDDENSESESEDEVENDDENENENETNRSISGSAKSKISEIVESETNIIQIEENNDEERNSKFKTKSFTLPFFFRYIAWIVSLGTIVTSIFFLFGYGITFGNDKTYQWLSSMIVSFFVGILIIEPLKVALISCCISSTCKNVDLDSDDDIEDDEKDPDLADQAQWMGDELKDKAPIQPIDEIKLDLIRIRRQKELEMWAIVKELSGYALFLLIAVLINLMSKDSNMYRLQVQLKHNFITKNGFDKISTSDDYWKWIHKTAITEIKAAAWYNGQPPYGLRGFIGDYQSRVMGYGTLRQIRVKPNSCRVHHAIINLTQECAQGSILSNEDETDYCNAWDEKTPLTEYLPSCSRPEFKFTSASEIDSMPYWAGIDSYGGGGYVYRIRGSSKTIRQDLKSLQQQRWINNHTRAVFLEFAVYNANVNLFGIATIVAEFIPGGGIIPYWRIDAVNLLANHNPIGGFINFCFIIFVCYILYFTYQFILDVKRGGCEYLDYWSLADMTIIFGSFIAFALMGYKIYLTNGITEKFRETKGNGYMKLQVVSLFDELYTSTMSIVLFVTYIKLIKLLRFNNRFSQLILTLKTCWEDLSGFLGIFFLVFFAFVQMFYMILQTHMEEFRSISAAFSTCFTMLLNKFKFGSLKETSTTAAVMFFFFAVSCTWILLNVLLTIIIEAFEKVKDELNAKGNQYEILDFVKIQSRYRMGTEKLPPRDNALIDDLTDQRREDNEEDIENEDSEDEFEDSNTTQLPQKVDAFLVYINDLYFDGELNMIDKRMFKKDMMGEDLDEFDDEENDDNEGKEKSNPAVSRRRVVFSSD